MKFPLPMVCTAPTIACSSGSTATMQLRASSSLGSSSQRAHCGSIWYTRSSVYMIHGSHEPPASKNAMRRFGNSLSTPPSVRLAIATMYSNANPR